MSENLKRIDESLAGLLMAIAKIRQELAMSTTKDAPPSDVLNLQVRLTCLEQDAAYWRERSSTSERTLLDTTRMAAAEVDALRKALTASEKESARRLERAERFITEKDHLLMATQTCWRALEELGPREPGYDLKASVYRLVSEVKRHRDGSEVASLRERLAEVELREEEARAAAIANAEAADSADESAARSQARAEEAEAENAELRATGGRLLREVDGAWRELTRNAHRYDFAEMILPTAVQQLGRERDDACVEVGRLVDGRKRAADALEQTQELLRESRAAAEVMREALEAYVTLAGHFCDPGEDCPGAMDSEDVRAAIAAGEARGFQRGAEEAERAIVEAENRGYDRGFKEGIAETAREARRTEAEARRTEKAGDDDARPAQETEPWVQCTTDEAALSVAVSQTVAELLNPDANAEERLSAANGLATALASARGGCRTHRREPPMCGACGLHEAPNGKRCADCEPEGQAVS